MSVTLTVTQVRVRYEGRRTSWDPDARYSYLVATNDIEAKVLSSDESEYVGGRAEMRQVRDLHGLQLLFSQEAELYVFDLPTLFLTLLSGLALLSMAKVSPSPSRSSSPSPRPLRLVRPHPSKGCRAMRQLQRLKRAGTCQAWLAIGVAGRARPSRGESHSKLGSKKYTVPGK